MNTISSQSLNIIIGEFIKRQWPAFVWFTVYLLIAGALQLYTSYPPDSDTAYHVAVGRLIREHGMLHSFPWTRFSWLADNYTDDKLIFHLLFVPLANVHWITAARVVGTLCGTVMLFVLYLILRTERIRYAGLWALIPLASSIFFTFRFILVRPHLLSIPLAIAFLWAASRGRLRTLGAVSVLYPWTYVAYWQIPALLLMASETARFFAGRGIRWKPAAVACAGIILGVATHPEAVNLVKYNWLMMTETLFKGSWLTREGFDMGKEIAPYPLMGWIEGLSITVVMAMVAVIYGWQRKREEPLLLSFALAALGFCILTMKSGRFAEYFVPFSVVAMAICSQYISWRHVAPVVFGVSLIYTKVFGTPTLIALSKLEEDIPSHVAARFQQIIPESAQVFTTGWNPTSILMLTLPDRYFMVEMEPTHFYMKDPELYILWYRLVYGDPPAGTAAIIRERFGARYVIIDNPNDKKNFVRRLFREPGSRLLYTAPPWMVFELSQPPNP